ncbi:hypothetical protein Tco_0741305 [Tanacetum coccineum]
MNEQSRYKQDKTKTRQSINVKSHIFNVKGDNDKSKQTPTRMSSVVRSSLKEETSTLGEIVSLNYIKSNKNVIGLRKSEASLWEEDANSRLRICKNVAKNLLKSVKDYKSLMKIQPLKQKLLTKSLKKEFTPTRKGQEVLQKLTAEERLQKLIFKP